MPRRTPAITVLVPLIAACSDVVGSSDIGDPVAGRTAFVESCASCHPSHDGLDLAMFAFPDTTIIRRALSHVSEATARDIVAHIRTFDVAPASRDARPFQPGGRVLESDITFAINLFGADAWPADLSAHDLAAIDPRDVAVAIPFPQWSSEADNTDWLSDVPFPESLLDRRPASPTLRTPRTYLDRYYDVWNTSDVTRAVIALRMAVMDDRDAAAPCDELSSGHPFARGEPERVEACFNALRWIASLAAQHALRNPSEPIPHEFHEIWWDVGNAIGNDSTSPIDQRALNRAAWRFLGWTFAPGDIRHNDVVYATDDLAELGLPRHAVFNSLRAMIARESWTRVPYEDAARAVLHAPDSWTYDVLRFGYEYLLSRLEAGIWPDDTLYPRQSVERAFRWAEPNLTEEQRAELLVLRDRLVELLVNH